MVACKHITRIVGAMVAAAVLACVLALVFPERVAETFGGENVALRYETELFNTGRVIEVDIQMDEDMWADMLAKAAQEEYYSCDVSINGETIHHVGIRPKGNTSLSSIVMDPNTDRYSFKLEFDHYVEGQSCFGLDKLILNNNFADATNMKEALVYDMYQYLGADASLYNYAKISVNGEYWGVYLALEAVEDSFQLRNYGTADGELYKPEGMGGGGRPEGGFPRGEGNENPGGEGMPTEGNGNFGGGAPFPEGEQPPSANEADGKGMMPGKGPSMGGSGANLNYTDDNLDSYSTIWEGEVTDTGKKDHRKVVTALKNISQGKDLEKYLDVDNVLRYMAVHVFSVNLDSLSGVMAHNYYLYEDNGKLNILPWDYNLSFGGMGMGMGAGSGASGMINDAIDTPFQATEFFDALLEDEEYLARYHEYLGQLADNYVAGGEFDKFYNRVRSQIDELAETDPTAFFSFEEYKDGAKMLYETVMLRAESIRGQLNGTIPSTDEGQRADSSRLIDASSIDTDTMGGFNRGGRGEDGEGNKMGRDWGESGDVEPEEKQGQIEGRGIRRGQAREVFYGEAAMAGGDNGFPGNFRPGNEAGGPPQGFGGPGGGMMPGDGGGRSLEEVAGRLAVWGVCLFAAVTALFMAGRYERGRKKK